MTARKRIVVLGAGGLARETAWVIEDVGRASPSYSVAGFVVTDPSKLGPHDSPVLGDLDWLAAHRGEIDGVVVGIGTPRARLKVAAMVDEHVPGLEWPSFVHPSVHIQRSTAVIEKGVVVTAGVIATVRTTLRAHAFVNLAVTIGHEVTIGAGSVVNPSVSISGGVDVGEGVLVGTGARILQYLRIGAGATIGAGAVVTKDVADGDTVVGIPARSRPA